MDYAMNVRRRFLLTVIIFLAAVAAGCVDEGTSGESAVDSDASTTKCVDDDCPQSEDGPNASGAAIGLNVSLVDCTGYALLLDTSRPIFEPEYPPGVNGTHSVLVFATFVVYDCAQAVLPDRVIDGFQLAYFKTLIDPVDGMPGGYVPFFVHQAFASDAGFAANVSGAYGLDVIAMAHPTFAVRDLVNGYTHVAFDLPPENPAYSLDAVLMNANREADRNDVLVYQGADGLAYFTDQLSGGFGNGAATTAFGPDSYWAQHGTAPAWSHLIAYRPDLSTAITFGGQI